MSAEHESTQELPLKGIYINFEDRSIEFEDRHGTVGRIVFTGDRLLVEGRPLTLAAAREAADERADVQHAARGERQAEGEAAADSQPPAHAEQREKQETVTLAGKLLTQPVQGKPDGRGQPTAWARFGAHVEGEDEAHLYGATFHKHTTAIALGLAKGSPLTVEGYPHQAEPGSKRLDTFSVIKLVTYPGKPDKGSGAGRRQRTR